MKKYKNVKWFNEYFRADLDKMDAVKDLSKEERIKRANKEWKKMCNSERNFSYDKLLERLCYEYDLEEDDLNS